MEMDYRAKEDYQNSVKYSLELLNLINKGKLLFSEEFIKREYWVRKNLVVAYNGLGQPAKAQEHKEYLYRAYKNKLLPEGIDEFFNYRFFKMGDKNIWAYEWFEELPKDRFSKSFTKVVYYIYSTNPDGSDKDQLYRLHALMFHGTDVKFDYVLTKKIDTPNGEVGGTLYQYVYNEDIDYAKLEADVRQVVASDQEPDTKSFRKK